MTNNHNRRNAIIAAASGIALLLGGSTYALWTANATLAGGKITAGNLDIAAVGTGVKFWDVSTDRDDETTSITHDGATTGTALGSLKGHLIADNTTWLMVPEDTVAAVFSYDITLTGDNLVASLDLNGDTLATSKFPIVTTDAAGQNGILFTYELYKDGVLLPGFTTPKAVPTTANAVIGYFQAATAGQADGAAEWAADSDQHYSVDPTTGKASVTMVVYAKFVQPDLTLVTATNSGVNFADIVDLSAGLKATLTQVRAGADDANNQFHS